MKLSECNLEIGQKIWIVITDDWAFGIPITGEPVEDVVDESGISYMGEVCFEVFLDELEAWTFSLNLRNGRLQKDMDYLQTQYDKVTARLLTRG